MHVNPNRDRNSGPAAEKPVWAEPGNDPTRRRVANKPRNAVGSKYRTSDEEQLRRLGVDLRNSIVQSLAALTANLDVVTMSGEGLDLRSRRVLEESSSIARDCFQQLLALADLLSPPPVYEIDLAAQKGAFAESE
jgi:hypothetical protein